EAAKETPADQATNQRASGISPNPMPSRYFHCGVQNDGRGKTPGSDRIGPCRDEAAELPAGGRDSPHCRHEVAPSVLSRPQRGQVVTHLPPSFAQNRVRVCATSPRRCAVCAGRPATGSGDTTTTACIQTRRKRERRATG